MKNLTIHFKNASALCLYYMEMEGQISDGKYENSRPYDHWKWIGDIDKMVVDGTIGIEGVGGNSRFWFASSKNYNLREWPGYIDHSLTVIRFLLISALPKPFSRQSR